MEELIVVKISTYLNFTKTGKYEMGMKRRGKSEEIK